MRFAVHHNLVKYAQALQSGQLGTTIHNRSIYNHEPLGDNLGGVFYKKIVSITHNLYTTGISKILVIRTHNSWQGLLMCLGVSQEDIKEMYVICRDVWDSVVKSRLFITVKIKNNECSVSLFKNTNDKQVLLMVTDVEESISTQAKSRYLFDVLIDNPMVIAWRTFEAADANLIVNIVSYAAVISKYEYPQMSLFVFRLFNTAVTKITDATLIKGASQTDNFKHLTLIAGTCTDISKRNRSYILNFDNTAVCSLSNSARDIIGKPIYTLETDEVGHHNFSVLNILDVKDFLTNEEIEIPNPVHDTALISHADNYVQGIAFMSAKDSHLSKKVSDIDLLLSEQRKKTHAFEIGICIVNQNTPDSNHMNVVLKSLYSGRYLASVQVDYTESSELLLSNKIIRPFDDRIHSVDCLVFNKLISKALLNYHGKEPSEDGVVVEIINEDDKPFSLTPYSLSVLCSFIRKSDAASMYPKLLEECVDVTSVKLHYKNKDSKTLTITVTK